MKRSLFLILSLFFLVVGCSATEEGGAGDNASESEEVSAATLYNDLDAQISTPGSSYIPSSLEGSFTFCAMITSDSHEMTFDDGTNGVYHETIISRNRENYFFLEVGTAGGEFEPGDIVKVTAELNGLVYWTEDNAKVDILDVKASSVEVYTPEEVERNTSGVITLEDGNKIQFISAHKAEGSFDEAIVAYFSFTNNNSDDTMPNLSCFYVEYGQEELSNMALSLSDVDPRALEAGEASLNTTDAGKTQLYYMSYTIPRGAFYDEPIYFLIYDDEFRMTDAVALHVFPSLADMNAAEETGTDTDTNLDANIDTDADVDIDTDAEIETDEVEDEPFDSSTHFPL